jgi:hypothetical protein
VDCCPRCGAAIPTLPPVIEHYTPPEDRQVPATLVVGQTVTRAIAIRWNERRYGEDLSEPTRSPAA